MSEVSGREETHSNAGSLAQRPERIVRSGPYRRSMTTQDTTHSVAVDRVHTGPEGPWEQAASRTHTAVPGVLGDRGRVGGDLAPGWRPVAGGSAVWDG